MSGEQLSFGQFRFDFARRELTRQGVPVRLGSRALDILAALVSARGEIVTKDELLARVWPGQVAEENNLQVQVSALRKALDEGKSGQSHLVSVPGRGYRLIGLTETPPDKPSIAILPFTNMSGDPEQAYFATGITEDIITELSRWREIMVKSRNATARYGPDSGDSAHIGRELSVQYILEGSVRQIGSRIRVTAQLVKASDGSHVWAERFDRNAEEIFAVQDEVIRIIVGTLAGRIRSERLAALRRRAPSTLAAYDCVLRGRALPWGDREADRQAKRLYEQAIELDPEYALAHALLALSIYVEWNEDPAAKSELLQRAWEIALKAVTLDPGEDMAHDALGFIELYRRNYDIAEGHLRRAISINPNDPEHLADLGSVLSYGGAIDEGLEMLRRARVTDPYFEPAWYWYLLCEAYSAARQYEAAIAAGLRAGTKAPRLLVRMAACHAHAGRETQASDLILQALKEQPGTTISFMAERSPFRRAEDLAYLTAGLRKAGLPE